MRLIQYTYPQFRRATPAFAFNPRNRSPWSGLESEIDRLFEDVWTDFSGAANRQPVPVDIYEDSQNTYVRAELPGLKRDDINVEIIDGELVLTATQKDEADDAKSARTFRRVVSVPEHTENTKVAAAYADGVLTVTLPKQETAKPRKINVAIN